jgi:hypothetical protein
MVSKMAMGFCLVAATISTLVGCGQGGAGPAPAPPTVAPSAPVEQTPPPAEEALPGGGEGAKQ